MAETDRVERLERPGAPLPTRNTGMQQPDLHVLGRGAVVEQVKGLEHEADPTGTDGGPFAVAEGPGVCAGKADLARAWPIEQSEQVEQRRLAGARTAHERDVLARPRSSVSPREAHAREASPDMS